MKNRATRPPANGLPEGITALADVLPAVMERLTIRLDEVADTLGISRRTLERERSAGRFPLPDIFVGKIPLWRPETVRAWIERGGR